MRIIVLLVSGVIGFLVAFSLTSAPEIEARVRADAADNSAQMARCERQLARSAPDPSRAADICGCMLREFDNRGLDILDAYGGKFPEMQDITRDCVSLYGG